MQCGWQCAYTASISSASEPLQPAAQDPSQEKFRRIRLGNAAFQARVGSLEGGVAALELLGFAREPADDALVLPAEKVGTRLCAVHSLDARLCWPTVPTLLVYLMCF